uniref:Nucleotide-diphospho-sugar transferase domain-containing protein n=2 Tax=Aegilops tauschii subsp. strangulata TaxID=200361 RepID=A0A453CXK9_AEGTS
RVLQKASMRDNTVILTTLNAAWASPGSVIDLFVDSFHSGVRTSSLLNHLVIIAFDGDAYRQCAKIHHYCFALGTEGVDFSEEKRFLTSGYLEMMWKRLDFLRLVLEKGYSFIFSIACDHYVGNATDLRNIANGGFNYVKSNERTIEFYSFWYSSRLRYPGYHDQDVFNAIKHDPYVADIGLEIKFLSTAYFGGFCEPSRDLNKVCTMHANCCIGLRSKIHDLRIMMEDWKNYLSLPPSLKRLLTLSWRVPQNCSLSSLN